MKFLRKPRGRVPVLATVRAKHHVTPNMIRLTLHASSFADIAPNSAGGHCKVILPAAGQDAKTFAVALAKGERPVMRTYTVRNARPESEEIDIDFVDHGDEGPASAFAVSAKPGDVCGFAGPGAPKLTVFDADWYLIAADMSALPVAAAALEALPRDANGIAIFEITSEDDCQHINAPEGIEQHWLVHPNPHLHSDAQLEFLRNMEWPEGEVRTMIAGETGTVSALRLLTRGQRGVDRKKSYASGYWRIGLVEDEHQKVKREETEADEKTLQQNMSVG
ncbi:MAG: siderophore-interacting protein [Cohaesibacteraceae bacterium]